MHIENSLQSNGLIKRLYNKILFFLAAIFFGYVSIRTAFPILKNQLHPLKGIIAFTAVLLLFLSLWIADKWIINVMNPEAVKGSVFILILINILFQLISLKALKVNPSWDFGNILTAADDISMGRPIRNLHYFQEYPYNLNAAVLVGSFKHLLGGFTAAPYFLNIIAVTSSIIGACFVARRLYGDHAFVLTAFFCLMVTPFYLNIPIVYTDSLSMPFVIWTVYFCTLIHSNRRKALLYCAVIGLLSASGYLIKQIAAIGMTAVIPDMLLQKTEYSPEAFSYKLGVQKYLTSILPIGLVLTSFLLFSFTFKSYIGYKGYDKGLNRALSIPYTHWLMMGMNKPPAEGGTSNGYGGFSYKDLLLTRQHKNIQQKKSAELAVIMKRLKQFGVKGYTGFLLKKIEWTWTDGTYYVPVKLGRLPVKDTLLHRIVLLNGGRLNILYLCFSQTVQLFLLMMIFIGIISQLKRKNNGVFRYMCLMSLGLMLFLLFWETRSRYLIFMLPVLIVMAVSGLLSAFGKMDRLLQLTSE